jgi:hypothetical protein
LQLEAQLKEKSQMAEKKSEEKAEQKKPGRKVRQETTLASGKKVRVFAGKAADLVRAQSMVSNPVEMQLGLAAILVEIDGQQMPVEDWREMDLEEYMEILPLLMPGSAVTQQSLLSPSPESSGGATQS